MTECLAVWGKTPFAAGELQSTPERTPATCRQIEVVCRYFAKCAKEAGLEGDGSGGGERTGKARKRDRVGGELQLIF